MIMSGGCKSSSEACLQIDRRTLPTCSGLAAVSSDIDPSSRNQSSGFEKKQLATANSHLPCGFGIPSLTMIYRVSKAGHKATILNATPWPGGYVEIKPIPEAAKHHAQPWCCSHPRIESPPIPWHFAQTPNVSQPEPSILLALPV